ncbi:hypothetical protein GQ42DRAFT_71642, partial [Ramicandelaber brevisporus]
AGSSAEHDIEIVLRIVRACGSQLRHDDPAGLKDVVGIVAHTLASTPAPSVRLRFMAETLSNLKNNRMRESLRQGKEDAARVKALIAAIVRKKTGSKHGAAGSGGGGGSGGDSRMALGVRLEDIRSVETRGKWWLVGAAWAGAGSSSGTGSLQSQSQSQSRSGKHAAASSGAAGVSDGQHSGADGPADNKLLAKLQRAAAKQGMRTATQRTVFVALMSSASYADAFESLMRLDLTPHQQQDVVRVVIRCCLAERTFNAFYALVGEQLCNSAVRGRAFRLTFMYALWDVLRALGEPEIGGMTR